MSDSDFYTCFLTRLTNKKISYINTRLFHKFTDDDIINQIDKDCDVVVFGTALAKYHRNFGDIPLVNDYPRIKNFIDCLEPEFYVRRGPRGVKIYDREFEDTFTIQRIEQLNISKPWIYTTSNFKFDHPNAVFHPIWMINTCSDTRINDRQIDISSPRTNLASFLLFMPHWDRLVALAMLSQQTFFDKFLYNFPSMNPSDDETSRNLHKQQFDQCDYYLTNAEIRQLGEVFVSQGEHLADPDDIIRNQFYLGLLTNSSFKKCYVNVFGESGYPHPNITEKSVLPFLSGQLPMIWGGDGLNDCIKDMGFETFDGIIPNVNLPELPLRSKIDVFINTLNTISENIDEIWHSTYEGRLHNYHWSRNHIFTDKIERPLKERLGG
jgi:hypothetical protein